MNKYSTFKYKPQNTPYNIRQLKIDSQLLKVTTPTTTAYMCRVVWVFFRKNYTYILEISVVGSECPKRLARLYEISFYQLNSIYYTILHLDFIGPSACVSKVYNCTSNYSFLTIRPFYNCPLCFHHQCPKNHRNILSRISLSFFFCSSQKSASHAFLIWHVARIFAPYILFYN